MSELLSKYTTMSGCDCVERWDRSLEELRQKEHELKIAEQEFSEARKKLGDWLVPSDAKTGEVFCLAVGSGFLQAEKLQTGFYGITWRNRPKEL